MFDAAKGVWVEKVSNKGQSTFFNPFWSEARIEYEVAQAFVAGRLKSPTERRFTAPTFSGIQIQIQIQFFSDNVRTTFYPTGL